MLKIISAKSSLAREYGLKKGDKIISFDGHDAVDTLDYIFYDGQANFQMVVEDGKGNKRTIVVEKEEEESFDLQFEKNDKIRTCHNNCVFCFVDQMAPNMRESLYIKDDDYTMSFMCGNFVTLTNVTDADIERIIRLHLSPLYVSVHTMDEKLRCELMNNRFAWRITQQLKKLTDAGITIHCQAVIVPNKNDGANLEFTARKLFEMRPYIADMAVVPTGLTKYRDGLAKIDNITEEGARELLELCDRLNEEFQMPFLLPADEYYIKCGKPFKSPEFYGDFSQIENGIGMTTKFIADFNSRRRKSKLRKPTRVAVITGVSAAQTINQLCAEAEKDIENLQAFALPVVNDFFGDSVTCTGLLTGVDMARALEQNREHYDVALIPSNTMKEFEDVFLDGMTFKQLQKQIKGKKLVINRKSELFFDSLTKV